MSIPMNVLQSMLAINAQAIHAEQTHIKFLKYIRSEVEDNGLSVEDCNQHIARAKHRMSLLERNQRAMSQEMQELIFQAHVDKLTNVEYNDDLIYH